MIVVGIFYLSLCVDLHKYLNHTCIEREQDLFKCEGKSPPHALLGGTSHSACAEYGEAPLQQPPGFSLLPCSRPLAFPPAYACQWLSRQPREFVGPPLTDVLPGGEARLWERCRVQYEQAAPAGDRSENRTIQTHPVWKLLQILSQLQVHFENPT